MVKKIISILFLFTSLSAFSQVDNSASSEGNQSFHRNEKYGSVFIHTNGFGAGYYQAQRITGFAKRILGVEVLNLKHAKETKSFGQNQLEDSRGFVYGKLNSALLIRPTYGRQKILYTKDAKKGVQISYALQGGPTLGFIKPIYLLIADRNGGINDWKKIEKFNPDAHSYDNIIGKAAMLEGIEETTLLPGLHSKLGFNFEYSPQDEILRAIETGIAVDAFIKKVPLMAFETNRQVYFTLFLNFHFGRKSI